MGFLGDLFKDVVREAKQDIKSEIRSEVRSDARSAVRGTIQGTKEGIGKASQAVKDGITGKNKKDPQVMQTTEASIEQPVMQPVRPVQAAPAPASASALAPAPAPQPVQAAPAVEQPVQAASPAAEAAANTADMSQSFAQQMNQLMNNPDSNEGKVMNAIIDSQLTPEQKAEMKEGMAALSDSEKVDDAKQALSNNPEFEAKLREKGVNPDALMDLLNKGLSMSDNLKDGE